MNYLYFFVRMITLIYQCLKSASSVGKLTPSFTLTLSTHQNECGPSDFNSFFNVLINTVNIFQ